MLSSIGIRHCVDEKMEVVKNRLQADRRGKETCVMRSFFLSIPDDEWYHVSVLDHTGRWH